MPSRERAVDRAVALAARRAGIARGNAPAWLRARALGVLESLGARLHVSLDEAADRLEADPAALEQLITALRVGETRFYRDPTSWEAIATRVVPALPPAVQLRVLSAGCSTGEEAYTLAMLLAAARRRFRVLGVDRSVEALATAGEGIYPVESERHLPPEWSNRFCERHPGGFRVKPDIRAHVSFERLDLVQRAPQGPFHLIVFKNVLLYLGDAAGEGAARRLAAELHHDGLLFVATSEVPRLRKAGLSAVAVAPGVTAFAPPGAAPRRW